MIFGSNTNHARTILFSRFTSSRLNPYAKELVYSKKGRNQTQIFVNLAGSTIREQIQMFFSLKPSASQGKLSLIRIRRFGGISGQTDRQTH